MIAFPGPAELDTAADSEPFDIAGKVRKDIRAGRTLAEVQAAKPTSAYTLDGDAERLVAAIDERLSKTG